MLELLDSILAFSAVLLGLSLLVTVLVQGLGALVNLRGWALAQGLAELFAQAKIEPRDAAELAQKILTHPLVSDSTLRNTRLTHWIQASAIRKEELLRLLADAEELGIEVSADVRARLDKAASVVSVWFDGQMDRVSQTFAHRARSLTITVSFLTAFALHIDASVLLGRMFSDSETRAKLVASVATLEAQAARITKAPPSGERAGVDEVRAAAGELGNLRTTLEASGVDVLPRFGEAANVKAGVHTYWDYLAWHDGDGWRHFLGILAAGTLLSLGAPFWFNLLRQLANLRTVLANKEAAEREQSKSAG
jgi:hypothetical protein